MWPVEGGYMGCTGRGGNALATSDEGDMRTHCVPR